MIDIARILILEDDEFDAELIGRALRSGGVTADTMNVKTRSEYESAIASFRPEVVLSDYNIPGYSGLSALEHKVATFPDAAFVLVTGTQTEEIAAACIRAGADDYILKSSLTRLTTAIDNALAKRQALREVRAADEEMRARERRFRALIEHSTDAIALLDPHGIIIYSSPAGESITGYTTRALEGRNVLDLIHEDDRDRAANELRSGGGHSLLTVRMRRESGELRWIEATRSNLLADPGIGGVVINYRDVTERRQLEQQLVRAQKMESIGMLAAGIAHEIGNPLTSISAIVQVIDRTMDDAPAKEKLGLIKTQIGRITRTIRELVDFSRTSPESNVATDVNAVIGEAHAIVRAGKKAHDIEFHLHLDPDLPRLTLIPDKLQQVVINLLMNAVDAMQSVEPDRRRKGIGITTRATDDRLTISISDNGSGIAPDALANIFNPFFTTKPVGEGTGLGLWVSYSIIQSFQGDIRVQSEVGTGTEFGIALPIHPPTREIPKTD